MLEFCRISYRVDGFEILRCVEGVVGKGEIVALVGPNGAGKSTLADIACGFRLPSSGRVLLSGRDITTAKPDAIARLGIARMFQGAHLSWNLSVRDNVRASLLEDSWLSTSRRRSADQIVMSIIGRVGLSRQIDEHARRLSFGQQRLLALARVLARPAQVLVLDEPFSGLKGAALEQVVTLLLEEAACGKSILIVDHLLSALRDMRCRFWYLANGQLTEFSEFSSLADSEIFRSSYKASFRPQGKEEQHSQSHSLRIERPVCQVCNATIGYGSVPVIENANLSVFSHESVGIVGLNGIGKSTLLRAVSGACRVFRGRVELFGENVESTPIYKRIRLGLRVLPQEGRLFRRLSVRANRDVARGGVEGWGRRKKDFRRSSVEYYEGREAGTLSGGEQARLALELLDIGDWSLVLLDEPTTGFDEMGKEMLASYLEGWREGGKAVVFVEHDFDFVVRVASRICIITHNGLLWSDAVEFPSGRALLEKVLVESEFRRGLPHGTL